MADEVNSSAVAVPFLASDLTEMYRNQSRPHVILGALR